MNRTSIYVSAASAEIERAESAMAHLRAVGFEITHDWTVVMREAFRREPIDAEKAAHDDLWNGIEPCDALIGLLPKAPSKGFWLEVGFAIGIQDGPHTILVGDPADACIWGGEVGAIVPDLEAAIRVLRERYGVEP